MEDTACFRHWAKATILVGQQLLQEVAVLQVEDRGMSPLREQIVHRRRAVDLLFSLNLNLHCAPRQRYALAAHLMIR